MVIKDIDGDLCAGNFKLKKKSGKLYWEWASGGICGSVWVRWGRVRNRRLIMKKGIYLHPRDLLILSELLKQFNEIK